MKTIAEPVDVTYLPAPVEAVTGVWKFVRQPYLAARARSLPGHLLHLVTEGRYTLRTNGREYRIEAGNLIYYHETEDVEWIGGNTRVVFYSVGFLAPGFKPLPIDHRVFRATAELKKLFLRIHRAWCARTRSSFAVHALLNELLCRVQDLQVDRSAGGVQQAPWWKAENRIREQRHFRPTVPELCRLAGVGRGVLFRSCSEATGKTPIQRVREVRMEEARGLLAYSHLNISQIAEYLGYPRIHEFTRDFSAYHGRPPRACLGGRSGG